MLNRWKFSYRESDMKRRESRTQSFAGTGSLSGRRAASLTRAAGALESLEARVLLAGDHASLSNYPNVGAGDTLDLNATTGLASLTGIIEPLGSGITELNDLFKFTTKQNPNKPAGAADFVTILADTLNSAGSTLNTRLDIFTAGQNGTPVPFLSATGNGTLTGGVPTDAWVGFLAVPGVTYYVAVSSQSGTTGAYTLFVDGITTVLTPNGAGAATNNSNLTRRGQDIVYSMTTQAGASFASLATAAATAATLDTRIEIYASGTNETAPVLISADDDAGRLQDAFTSYISTPSTTYYFRVRSDQFTAVPAATGAFTITVDAAATPITLDPVTRRGQGAGTAGSTTTFLFSFQAQASGLAIITVPPAGLPPVDTAARIFTSTGQFVAFNDDLVTASASVEVQLVGGETYFGVIDGFQSSSAGAIAIVIEANHTFDAAQPVDDHATNLDYTNATPLVFGAPAAMTNWVAGGGTLADRNNTVLARGHGRIHNTGDTDLFTFTPQVDMLSDFAGKGLNPDPAAGQPTPWQTNKRPGSRLMLLVTTTGETGTFIFQPTVEIIDSAGAVVATNAGAVFGGNPMFFPLGASTGFWDPASFDETMQARANAPYAWWPLDAMAGPKVWGGEQYFVRVGGNVKGRYNFYLFLDSVPPTVTAQNTRIDRISTTVEQLENSQIAAGTTLPLGINNASGSSGYEGGIDGVFDLSGGFERGFNIGAGNVNNLPPGFNPFAAGTGIVILQESGFGAIEYVSDTDVYQIRPQFTGSMEIRINTTAIDDFYNEFIADGEPENPGDPPPQVPVTNGANGVRQDKTINSPLDSALRVFRGDFTEVAYNNDNPAISGESQSQFTFVGANGDRTYHRRDARIVIDVVASNTYYIQVESGQLANFNAHNANATLPVAWGNIIGSYELLIQTMPNLGYADDHDDFLSVLSTVLPINSVAGSGGNGTASAAGVIDNIPQNPADTDVFTFLSPVRAVANVTVSRAGGGLLIPTLEIYEQSGAGFNLVANVTGNSAGIATTNIPLTPGGRYYFAVYGAGNSEGGYSISMTGIPFADPEPDFLQSQNATAVQQFDFLGTGTVDGRLEQPGDTDVFKFEASDFQTFTVHVNSRTEATLNPVVTIYELALDPVNNTILQRIAFNDNVSVTDFDAEIDVAVTPNRINGGRDYRWYYVVISGFDPSIDYGDYTLSLVTEPSDDHPDATEWSFADTIIVESGNGSGTDVGTTEKLSDTDLFQFTSPAGGQTSVTVSRPTGSTMVPRVTVYRLDNGVPTTLATATATDGGFGFTPAQTSFFDVDRNAIYYILVENSTATIGNYTVSINGPELDDYPNQNEFDLAFNIALSPFTGDGQLGTGVVGDSSNPRLGPIGDTDLFKFFPVRTGPVTVTLTSYSGAAGNFAPRIRFFGPDQLPVAGGDVSTNTLPTGNAPVTVTFTFDGTGNQPYYLLVSAVTGLGGLSTETGEYKVFVNTTTPSGGNGGDPGAIDFLDPDATIALDSRTGDGQHQALIDVPNDRDLYTFIVPAGAFGRAYVQVLAPDGSFLDASVTILNAPTESAVVASDSAGLPGVTANTSWDVTRSGNNQQFWVIVSGVAATTGGYTLVINTEPVKQYLYYPEGYASLLIKEFVSIVNNNDYTVQWSLKAYYEDGTSATLVDGYYIDPGLRDGITLSNGPAGPAPGHKLYTPYALVVESNGPLGATLAHYDFGTTLGDTFTERTSSTWSFARVERNPGAVNDYVLFYNPNNFYVDVEVTAFSSTAGTVSLGLFQVAPNTRLGVDVNAYAALPVGVFAMTLTSRASTIPGDAAQTAANQAAFVGIVASLSHYDSTNRAGFALLGEPDGGSTQGVIPQISNGDAVFGELVLFNPNNSPATVTITGTYITAGLPDRIRNFTLAPRQHMVLAGADMGFTPNQAVGVRYESTLPVAVLGTERQFGEGNATSTQTRAGTAYVFGDGFMNRDFAGDLYFETIAMHNPTAIDSVVTIKLLFGFNDFITVDVPVRARGYALTNLHELQALLDHGPISFYSIQLTSSLQFVATFTHYDLYLGGGYTSSGVPLGIVNTIASIP